MQSRWVAAVLVFNVIQSGRGIQEAVLDSAGDRAVGHPPPDPAAS